LGLLMLAMPAFAGDDTSAQGFCVALDKAKTYVPPFMKIASLLIVVAGVAIAFVEFVRRQIGWALGAFIMGIIIGAVVYALAGGADKLLSDIYGKNCGG